MIEHAIIKLAFSAFSLLCRRAASYFYTFSPVLSTFFWRHRDNKARGSHIVIAGCVSEPINTKRLFSLLNKSFCTGSNFGNLKSYDL